MESMDRAIIVIMLNLIPGLKKIPNELNKFWMTKLI